MSGGRQHPSSLPTLGVEEELFLVDRETWALADAAPGIVAAAPPGRLEAELFECIVEAATPVLTHPRGTLDALVEARRMVMTACAGTGVQPLAVGIHPRRAGERPAVTDSPHYRAAAARLGDALEHQLVCGLHIHVGLGSFQRARNALEGMIPWLPSLLAVAVNSPFDDGRKSPLLSVRAGRLGQLEASPLPSPTDDDSPGAAPEEEEQGWWDIRVSRRYGTLEIRVPDQPTDVRRAAALAAITYSLVVQADRAEHRLADRATYSAARERALAGDWSPAAVARHVEPTARELGTWGAVVGLLDSVTEAETQLEIVEEHGVDALLLSLVDRTVP